jgi:hypothetical protein
VSRLFHWQVILSLKYHRSSTCLVKARLNRASSLGLAVISYPQADVATARQHETAHRLQCSLHRQSILVTCIGASKVMSTSVVTAVSVLRFLGCCVSCHAVILLSGLLYRVASGASFSQALYKVGACGVQGWRVQQFSTCCMTRASQVAVSVPAGAVYSS